MFKKLTSVALAAMLIGSAAVAVGAAENDNAVAAVDDSAVAAADDSGATGAGNVIYFDAGSTGWNYDVITFYLYSKADGAKITWGSKKGNMKKGDNDIWSFDLSDYSLGENYACIFTADWDNTRQTCGLIITSDCIGDIAYCTGEMVENDVDSNKKNYAVKWRSGKLGNPKIITSIGNIVGDTYWVGEDANSLFYTFISTEDEKSIKNAVKYNGKTEQQTIDDTAKTLGLSFDDVKSAVEKAKAAGAKLDWDASKSSLADTPSAIAASTTKSGSNTPAATSATSAVPNVTTDTATVTSGEGTTVYFIIAGLMLAAIGVFFLARKKTVC